MRVRTRSVAGVKLDMTPLIDVVFQLLAFFCLTFRIATLEGDLAMQPPAQGGKGPITSTVPPMLVVLRADDQGGLRSLEFNGRPLAGVEQLHQEVVSLFGSNPDLAAQAEARLDCDERLAYQHTIAAVTALTGQRLPSGEIQPLVGKVRFVR
jgi:biopolymer transport protein ExbD